ncbi:hypothetical protein M3223_09370 [Paenibacillus pasadenensis]|uniref:hypothetical protein n=1 Tax=Paenibacillus pasadenensis TaxID=217090 RepID=UPI00203D15C8|nr:hypothetical protein [Paenibacillus pasadenensis]MCM3747565.1 hypothetical protein [Paenibacillus pasadenensis]
MNKNYWKFSAGALVLTAGILIGANWSSIAAHLEGQAAAASADNTPSSAPGTADDPVVTKSYVDQKIAELKAGGGGSNPTPSPTPQTTPTPGSGDGEESDEDSFRVINVPVGKTLVAADGAEVVVRAGKAVAYSPDSNGIADVTAGTNISSGSSVPQNHLILFPRGGRGVGSAAGVKSGLTVMIRGGYELQTIKK